MMIFAYMAAGAILLLLAVMIIRAVLFKPSAAAAEQPDDIRVDTEAASKHLSDLVQFKTISRPNPDDVDWREFDRLQKYLDDNYPLIRKSLKKEVIAGHSLLFCWKGKNPGREALALLSHMDVVPVMPGTEADWEHDAFSGDNDGEFIWGRGTLDMKGHLVSVMESVEGLLRQGFEPECDIYLCFGHNEEVVGSSGGGAKAIAETLKARGVKIGCVLDEGGAIVPGAMVGIGGRLATIGIAEKGYADIRITAAHIGGHSSQPPRNSGLVQIADAVVKLEKRQFMKRMTTTVSQMFGIVGRYMSFGKRLLFANMWLAKPLVLSIFTKMPATNAMIRTTTAPTMTEGSPAANVLPQTGNVTVNFRVLQGEKIQDVFDHIRQVTGNSNLKLELLRGKEPSAVSPTDSREYAVLSKSIRQIFGAIPVAPYLMVGGTDSCFYEILTASIYCISPFEFELEDLKRIHGTNEKIKIGSLEKGIKLITQFILNYCR